MHVLLLALNYYPDKLGNAPLMTGLCEGLVQRGHRVSVVCAFPHHEKGRIEAPYRGKLFQRDQHNGVDILRTYIYAPEGGAVAKMANYASFTGAAFAAAATVRDVDVIFTPSPPLTLGVVDHALSRMRGVPFVYNLQDLFPEAAIRLGMLTNPRVIAAFEKLESWVYTKAHRLSVISEGFRQHLLARGVPDQKISVIPNYTDTDFITPRPLKRNPFRKAHGLRKKFVVQFSGRMGYSQGLETVVDAWRSLSDLPDLRLMMVGDGQARSLVEGALSDDPRVTLLPTQPREALPDLLAAANVGLAPLRHGMSGVSVPSKIFGIMAAGRPVIAGADAGSDTIDLVEAAQGGIIVTPESPDELAEAIRALYHDRKRAKRMGKNARKHVESEHSHQVVVDRYEAMLLDLGPRLMCGLVGYVGRVAPVTRQRLVRMRDTLTHRGPDDAGLWIDAQKAAIGLGHRRLSIIDTRAVGRQPMSDASGQIHLAFNGEIYNFEALRDELAAAGHRFRTRTDTEVIIELYRAYGLDCLQRLNGMFAIALWDEARGRLLLARDRMGIKPLFVAERPDGTILFGSEIKALLASKAVDDALDLQAHFDYLALNYTPGPRTALRGVQKLQPGHMLVWEDGRARRKRYWQLDFTTKERMSFPEAAEAALVGLRAAVKRRMIADVPLGMFLSGGIDSTAVLMCMAEASDRPVKAFTIRFGEAEFDESEYARIAANHFGAEHHVETVTPDVDTFLEPLTQAMDEPYADSSAIPLWYLSRLARQHVTVALGGDGGDELFAGYRTHFAWRLANAYRRLPGALRDRLIPALVDRLPVSHGKVSFDLKARYFVQAAARTPAEAHFGFKEFLREDARRELMVGGAGLESTERLFDAAFAAQPFQHGLDAVLFSDFELYLPDDILVKVDRMSMSHGLEARVPFLDHEFAESTARFSANHKLRGLQTKAALKRALRGRVPEVLLKRRKAGFNVPMAQWLSGPLNPLLRDMLSRSRVQRIGLWRPEGVDRLLSEHENKVRDHSRTLWALLCFSLFNARFRGDRSA